MKKISDYERGLYRAAELGPMRWAKIAQKAKDDGYNDVRHFLECVMAEPPDYINGLLEGMGHAGDTIDTLKKELAALNAELSEIEDKIEQGSEEYGLKIDRDNLKDMIVEVEDQIIRAEHPEDFPE